MAHARCRAARARWCRGSRSGLRRRRSCRARWNGRRGRRRRGRRPAGVGLLQQLGDVVDARRRREDRSSDPCPPADDHPRPFRDRDPMLAERDVIRYGSSARASPSAPAPSRGCRSAESAGGPAPSPGRAAERGTRAATPPAFGFARTRNGCFAFGVAEDRHARAASPAPRCSFPPVPPPEPPAGERQAEEEHEQRERRVAKPSNPATRRPSRPARSPAAKLTL